eukprot:1029029-Amphidinium_carterae.1
MEKTKLNNERFNWKFLSFPCFLSPKRREAPAHLGIRPQLGRLGAGFAALQRGIATSALGLGRTLGTTRRATLPWRVVA